MVIYYSLVHQGSERWLYTILWCIRVLKDGYILFFGASGFTQAYTNQGQFSN